jgi:hypothetical protein
MSKFKPYTQQTNDRSNFRAIPQPLGDQKTINAAVKENLEMLAGLRNNRIDPLVYTPLVPGTSTTTEIAEQVILITNKINEILWRIG